MSKEWFNQDKREQNLKGLAGVEIMGLENFWSDLRILRSPEVFLAVSD